MIRKRTFPTETTEAILEKRSLECDVKPMRSAHDAYHFIPALIRQRYAIVAAAVETYHARKILDVGCCEARLFSLLRNIKTVNLLCGVDINPDSLSKAYESCKPPFGMIVNPRNVPLRINFYLESICSLNPTFFEVDWDVVTGVEVIEHLEQFELQQFVQNVFGELCPKLVVITTPNVEFNVVFGNPIQFRDPTHKFEMTREEFTTWAHSVAKQFNYSVTFGGVGDPPPDFNHVGYATQIAYFARTNFLPKERLVEFPSNQYLEIIYPFKDPEQDRIHIIQKEIYSVCKKYYYDEDIDETNYVSINKLLELSSLLRSNFSRDRSPLEEIIKDHSFLEINEANEVRIKQREENDDLFMDD